VVARVLGHDAQAAADLAGGRRAGEQPEPPHRGRSARSAGPPPHGGDGEEDPQSLGYPGAITHHLHTTNPAIPPRPACTTRDRLGSNH
jgi:hypothetical protein